MEQFEHPQPQFDLPFFLSLILPIMIKETSAINAKPTIIEPMFSINHIMFAPFVYYFLIFLSGRMIANENSAITATERISPIIPHA